MLSSRQLEQFLDFLTGSSASVRLFIFFLIWLLLWMPIAIPLAVVLKWHPCRYPTPPSQKLPLVASLYALAPVVIWGEAVLEKVSLTEYGVCWCIATLQSLGFGLILGVLGLVVMFTVQWRLGWLQVQSLPVAKSSGVAESSGVDASSGAAQTASLMERPMERPMERSIKQGAAKFSGMLLSLLGIALWISLIEELVFRGFLLNQLQRDYAAWVAVTIASLVFALLHLIWEGSETLPQLPGLWLMGVVLSIARWTDHGNLGLAIGLHTGWIWTIASLDTTHLLHDTGKAPEWLTGLGGKLLAGMMGLLFLCVTAVVLFKVRNLGFAP